MQSGKGYGTYTLAELPPQHYAAMSVNAVVSVLIASLSIHLHMHQSTIPGAG